MTPTEKALVELRHWLFNEGCTEQVAIADKALAAADINQIWCSRCDGVGEWDEGPLPAATHDQISPDYRNVKCPDCNGSGRISITA